MFTIAVFSYSMSSINAIRTMYKANVFVLFALIAYTLTLGVEMGGEQRIEESEITANTYGYYVFTGLFSLFLLYTTNRLNNAYRKIYIVIITVASIFSLWLILASASRGAAIIVSLLIGGNIFIISVISKKTILKKVIISIFFFLGIFYFAVFFTKVVPNDTLFLLLLYIICLFYLLLFLFSFF